LLAVALLAVTVLSPLSAGAQTTDDPTATVSGNDYVIVTLTGSPAAADDSTKTNGRFDPASKGYQKALSRMQRQHERFADQLARVAPDAEVVDEYFITANAVALKLNGSSLSKIGKIAGVEKTAESALYSLDLSTSVDLIYAPDFWSATTGRADAGEGVKVGIIDSGIYPDHPFFRCKDVHFGGIYYSGVGMAPPNAALPAYFGPHYIPAPGWPLYFSAAHGTHVAGIIGGCVTTIEDYSDLWDGTTVSGVAPGAELHDYNVFPAFGAGYVAFGGSAFSDDIAHAIEDAVADGMQVINMSLGGTVQGPHDFLAEVANEAVEAGVVVVTSAGNEGPGWYTVGSPGSASEVIATGATTNTRTTGVVIEVVDGDEYHAVPGEFPNFDGSTYNLVLWTGDDSEACSLSGNESHSGKVVLISRGTCSFSQKIENAYLTGALGAVVYNYPGQEPIIMATSPGFPDEVPAVMVSYDDAMELVDTSASISAPDTIPTTPDEIADFSSRGPAPFTNIIKPDVMAPGVDILSSTMEFNLNSVTGSTWELYNGTSMAAPHVAGSAAALLCREPRLGRG